MNNCKRLLVLLSLAVCSVVYVHPQIQAVKLTETISVDGKLTEKIWHTASPITDFRQREPNQGEQPTERTEAWIAYDDNALYVGARLYDSSPDSIMAFLSRRDNLNTADWFGLFLDPYNDKRSGNYFVIGPSGTIGDGVLYNDDWDDSDWDGVWEANAQIDEIGWTLEMKIPFSQLRFQQIDIQQWGINIRRDIGRKNEQIFLEYTPRGQSGFVSRFRTLTGIHGITPSNALEVRPFTTTKHERTHPAAGDPFNSTGKRNFFDLGADIKYGISSNLILDGAINPDFGQVEVDPAVVNLSDVESFFQEKRPFFIEGSSTFSNFGRGGGRNYWNFNFPQPTFFYSRRIGRVPYGNDTLTYDFQDAPIATDILGAGKITGKIGEDWNVGMIHALTSREHTRYQYNGCTHRAEIEPQTYFGVGRIQKEIDGGRQGIGILSTYTDRNFSDRTLEQSLNSRSLFSGIDGWTFLDQEKMWVITGYAGMSYVEGTTDRMINLQRNSTHYFQRPDAGHLRIDSNATSLIGSTGRVFVIKQKGNSYVNASFGFHDPKFEINDLGFLSRSDVVNMHLGGGYMWTEPEGISRFREFGGGFGQSYDFGGNLTHSVLVHWGYIRFMNYYSINYNAAVLPVETYNTRRTRGGPLTLNSRGFELNMYAQSDDRKDISGQIGLNSFSSDIARYVSISVSIQVKPTPYITLSVGPQYSSDAQTLAYIGIFSEPLSTRTYGKQYVFADLQYQEVSANIRLDWTFTPNLSLQLYVQPLISSGTYSGYKEIIRPRSNEYLLYGLNGSSMMYDAGANEYRIDADGNGPIAEKTFDNPNFNFKSMRGNAVVRWEYLPGSTVFFVWTQSRNDIEENGDLNLHRSVARISAAQPDNIFMVKISYYFSM
jgi:hypothetical protein